jgi:hypothetical protein
MKRARARPVQPFVSFIVGAHALLAGAMLSLGSIQIVRAR